MDSQNGARCRLSACAVRFVGPMLFTTELTGRCLATTSGNDPLSPGRQPGCDTCRISGQIGCRPAARTQRFRINSPVPTPGGTVGKEKDWSGVRESKPRHLLGRQRPIATRPTPLNWRASCFALRLPVSMRRIVACAGLSAGVFGWCESADPALSLPLRPRPCAGGKANQNSTEPTLGWSRPSKACDHDGLWQPAATHVSSGFLIAVIMGARFVRALETEVKRRLNISTADITLNIGGAQLRRQRLRRNSGANSHIPQFAPSATREHSKQPVRRIPRDGRCASHDHRRACGQRSLPTHPRSILSRLRRPELPLLTDTAAFAQ
jgi:hypothetical protein